jgi:hypothetical protein
MLNQFQVKVPRRQMNVPAEQAPNPEFEVGSRGGNSIPFALLSLACLVCFLRHNSKSKRIYAIKAVD